MRNYVVETAALRKNLDNLKKRAGAAPIWAVLKGNGYGLGLVPMAQQCAAAGITRFAVTEVSDVQRLRDAGFAAEEILMLRPLPDAQAVDRLLELGAILTVSSLNDAAVINGAAVRKGCTAEVHLKIDTGMGRYGFLPTELKEILSVYQDMDRIAVSGIYTHFHSAFCNKKQTYAQAEALQGVCSAIRTAGHETGMVHCCNSAALLRYPDLRMDAVRVGSSLLGRLSTSGKYGLKRVGFCETTVEELRWLPKGHTCGYGAAWKAKRPTRIAVMPVGWYHGFGCEMGNDIFRFRDNLRKIVNALRCMIFPKSFHVTVNGKRCKVLGHIGMLHTVCDVTKVNCAVGDPVQMDINPLLLKDVEVVFR